MNESQIVGFILLVVGGLNVVRPDILIKFQIWTQRVIMGARYEPSTRTHKIVRIMGVAFVALGFFAITGVVK